MKKESIGLVKKFNKMLQKSPSELFGQLCIYMCVCIAEINTTFKINYILIKN